MDNVTIKPEALLGSQVDPDNNCLCSTAPGSKNSRLINADEKTRFSLTDLYRRDKAVI